MPDEQYVNNIASTLNGAITNVATSLVVTSATGFPTTGNFRIIIDSEILLVTAVSGTTFTVARGQEGTSGAAHSDLAPVTQVLTAESARLLPRQPQSRLYLCDDWLSGSGSPGSIGQLGWTTTNGAAGVIDSSAGRPGLFNRSTSATISTLSSMHVRSSVSNGVMNGGETFDNLTILRLNTNDANTQMRIGFQNPYSGNPPTNGIYFEKLDADTNWFGVCRSGGTQTRADTGVAVSTSFARFRIRRIDGTTIGFSIDDSAEVTITTNIPGATSLNAGQQIINSAASAKTYDIDYWDLLITGLAR